jgi:NTP pyrophosphatase (non-canonical NTP hydrolase)
MTLQSKIGMWYVKNGGRADTARCAQRALEELFELIEAIKTRDSAHIKEEAADVAICLMVIADAEEFDLIDEMAFKHAINESRKWKVSPDGALYHVKEA